MRTMRRRSNKGRDGNEKTVDRALRIPREMNQPSPWKIVLMLLFLAVLAVLLLQNDDDPKNGKKKRKIPNPETPLPPSPSALHTFKHAAVSSDSQVCSDIARDFLKSGANVFDGAVSSLLCNSLTQIQSMGLLGGFLLTVYMKAERKSIVIDAQMSSPKAFRLPIRNVTEDMNGPLAVGVPGFLKGLWEIHQKYGSVSWRDLIEPTLNLCNDGIIVTKHLYDSIYINPRIVNDPYLREMFVVRETRKFKRPGSTVVLVKHCQFLEMLANHNETDIYSGEVGEVIANDLKEAGSVITIDDLKDYKVKWSAPIEYSMTNDLSMLVPNTAAVQIPSILNILKKYGFNSTSFDSEKNINGTILSHHRIVEAFKHSFAERSKLGDPDYVDVKEIVEHLLSREYAQDIIARIDDTKTLSEGYSTTNLIAPNDHGTSHMSLVAANGDALSVTCSINYYFGAGITGKRSGLIFNNGMDDFSFPDRAVNYFGLEETPTNYPEPGKRALSSMSPIIVIDKKSGNVRLVIGAAGGSKIITVLAIVLLRFSCCSKNLKEIVDTPRFHHQYIPNEIVYEFGLINGVVEGLAEMGHDLKRFNNRGTIVNALSYDNRDINGIADYRKDWSGVAGY